MPSDEDGVARGARPQLTGLNFAIARIQPGMSATVTRIEERNIKGIPIMFETAIIDACFRISSATPCEKPEKTPASSADAARTVNQPSTPPWTRTPSASPTSRMTSACTKAVGLHG